MQKAKMFFLVSGGIFLLAFAFHLGAQSASAQQGSPGSSISVALNSTDGSEDVFVITPNGDVYQRGGTAGWKTRGPAYIGNFWGGGTTTPPKGDH